LAGFEKKNNPYFNCKTKEEFIDKRRTRDETT